MFIVDYVNNVNILIKPCEKSTLMSKFIKYTNKS